MNIADALSGQTGLAGVQWALRDSPAHEALCAALDGLLEPSYRVGHLHLHRAKFKPGRRLTAYYDVSVQAHDAGLVGVRPIEVNWRLRGAEDPRGDLATLTALEAEALEASLATPFRGLLADDPAWGMYVQVSPLDAEFTQLVRVSSPPYIASMLAQHASGGATLLSGHYGVTTIRYRPGQRHVLRYDPLDHGVPSGPGGTIFAKIYNSDKGARAFHVAATVSDWLAEHNAGIAAVRPLTYIPAEQVALYPCVTGTPLSHLLREGGVANAGRLRQAGVALAALHRTPESLVELQSHSFAKELKSIASAGEHIRVLLPSAGAQLASILERAQALYPRMPLEPPGFAYGDFKADHLWLGADGELTLIDFDTCYYFDQAIDLGKFLADLHWWFDGYGLTGVPEAQAQFLAGYNPNLAPERLLNARLYEVLVLTKTTARRVKLFDPDWAERTMRLFATADRLLAELEGTIERG